MSYVWVPRSDSRKTGRDVLCISQSFSSVALNVELWKQPAFKIQILASTNVLSDSMNLTILGASYKRNQTVFVCVYYILERILRVNPIV